MRPLRHDPPGSWHHVMNRGLAHRTAFESRREMRFFESRMARVARRGDLEIHSFCLVPTHFHILVRSPVGRLPEGMKTMLEDYTRRFNLPRDRDGTIWRGRYHSVRVLSERHRAILIPYLDFNPVLAGIVASPPDYAYGSARLYMRGSGPLWLERTWVEKEACARAGASTFNAEVYQKAFGLPLRNGARQLLLARMRRSTDGEDPLDDLVGAAPPRVRQWMESRARLADQTKPGLPVADPDDITAVLADGESRFVIPVTGRIEWPGASALYVVRVALWRDLGGLTYSEISRRLGQPRTTLRSIYERHALRMSEDPDYAAAVGLIGSRILALTFGVVPGGGYVSSQTPN